MLSDPNDAGAADMTYDEPAVACTQLLFRALVETDGDAALLHTGGAPQLVTPIGRLELVKTRLTVPAVERLLSRLLSDSALDRLESSGVVQYDYPTPDDLPGEQFSIIAARLHHDVRLEVRRLRLPDDDSIPEFLRQPVVSTPQGDDQLALPPADELWPS